MVTLRKIQTMKELHNLVSDKDVAKSIDVKKEPVFISGHITTHHFIETNNALDIEIALRKCGRVGVFGKNR